ncbi:MAG: hypothetical protein Q8N34_03385 [Gammaproteobacteria bacterium]|nr:hypothetical protein [Gammaproteobacteria bacterium]
MSDRQTLDDRIANLSPAEKTILERAYMVGIRNTFRDMPLEGALYTLCGLNKLFLMSRAPGLSGIEAKRCKTSIASLNMQMRELHTKLPEYQMDRIEDLLSPVEDKLLIELRNK